MIDIVAFDGCKTGAGGSGVAITVVLNYSALPDPTTVTNKYYWAEETEGTKWLPLSVGGTFHNSGLYYSNGTEWQNSKTPFQATLAEVNTGTNMTRFVSPYAFSNSTKIVNSFQKNVDDTDDIAEGTVNFFVPLYINDTAKYLDSSGNWTEPAGTGVSVGIKNHLKTGDDITVEDCFQYLSYSRMTIDAGVTVTIDEGGEYGVHNGILKNDGLIINNGIIITD